jgi:hypothetical protein
MPSSLLVEEFPQLFQLVEAVRSATAATTDSATIPLPP